jgi:GTP-binding protein Era
MNALVGERMSIVTHKPQTTRHRILGILSGEHFQLVFSDTPGYVKDPSYVMHKKMNRFVEGTLEDADLLMLMMIMIRLERESETQRQRRSPTYW